MKPIIKWPGGKSREIDKIEHLIPSYDRYIEPFFGGGALFFHLSPKAAVINDISESLMQYYKLIKAQDRQLYELLMCYNDSFNNIVSVCGKESLELLHILTSAGLWVDILTGMFEKKTESTDNPYTYLAHITSNFSYFPGSSQIYAGQPQIAKYNYTLYRGFEEFIND